MPLTIGTQLGSHEITGLLGKGGMGEVYRARDLKLKREVAIKILPEEFARDSERVRRFQREAEFLASLNQPNIAGIYDLGEQSGSHYLVLELVEGETLAERIVHQRISVREALNIAVQICEALEAAHEKGIIHRDLKPANIKITPDGRVKVLDFGLAKLRVEDNDPFNKRTKITESLSGSVAGTVAYMSPEQAKGKEVDRKTDVWAFGCVLYEMLTGRASFEGETTGDILNRVFSAEPDWSLLPSETPENIRRLLGRCLAKDLRLRLRDIGDIRLEIEDADREREAANITVSPRLAGTRIPTQKSGRWYKLSVLVAVLFGILALAAITRSLWIRPSAQSMRFTIAMPDKVSLAVGENSPGAGAISPDGARIVFVGVDAETGKIFLYVRPIDAIDAVPLPGTEDASSPFWSPNSRSVAFFAHGKLLRVDLRGGAPQVICEAPTVTGAGTWNRDDVIVANLSDLGPLSKVAAAGGSPVPVTILNASKERRHAWPQFLPDGKHFLFTSIGVTPNESSIYAGNLDSTDTKLVLNRVASSTAFAPQGYLLFLQAGSLIAQPFDVNKLETSGKPFHVADRALPPFSVSENGMLMYRNSVVVPSRFLWVDWDGREIGPAVEPGYYDDPALSPDGSKLAFAKRDSLGETMDVWILDLTTKALKRLTSDPANDRGPVWSPDGNSIVFWSTRPSGPGLYRKSSNGIGDEELIVPSKDDIWPYQWSADGRYLVYFGGASIPEYAISMFVFAERRSVPLIHTSAVSGDGAASPDGHWLAYEDNSTGRYEAYLTTLPPSTTKLSVTTGGGVDALWSSDGKKLFYVNSITRELWSMDVKLGNLPQFSLPRRIHPGPLDWTSAHSFDIDTKQHRVLIQVSPQSDITVLLNWQAPAAN